MSSTLASIRRRPDIHLGALIGPEWQGVMSPRWHLPAFRLRFIGSRFSRILQTHSFQQRGGVWL